MRAPIFAATLLAAALVPASASAQRAANLPPTARPAAAIAPKVLLHRAAPTSNSRSFIGVGGGKVFLSHASVLESVPRAGGPAEHIAAVTQAPVAANASSVHWVDGNLFLRSMPLPHGPIAPMPEHPQQSDWFDAQSVVIAGESLVTSRILMGVGVRPLSGGPTTILLPNRKATAIASGGDEAFVLLRHDGAVPASIERVAPRAGASTHLTSIDDSAYGLAVDGAFVYWSVRGPGTFVPDPPGSASMSCFGGTTYYHAGEVWRAPRAGGKAERVARGIDEIGSIVVGRSSIFASRLDRSGVTVRIPKTGGTPRPIGKYAAIVTDGADVFALDDKGDLVTFVD